MPRNKKGMSLIEMLVAIGIFSMSITGFTILFVRTWSYNHYTLEMGEASMKASEGMRKMVNYMRSARQADDGSYPIKSADSDDLVLYADYDKDGVVERLHFYKSGQNVLMGVRNPSGGFPVTYSSGDEETITLVGSVVNGEDDDLFTYYNQDYPGDDVNNPLESPADPSEVRLVEIFLHINIDPNRAPDNIKVRSFVELRNLSDYDRLE